MNKKVISLFLGLIVFVSAFLSVFGNPFPKLIVDEDEASGDSTIEQPVENEPVSQPVTPKPETKPTPTPTPDPAPKPVSSTPEYSMTEISSHDSATSCWSAINANVYDLTAWVNRHPGGKASILMICGKDGSPLFNMQHGSSNRVASILANYKIGKLKN